MRHATVRIPIWQLSIISTFNHANDERHACFDQLFGDDIACYIFSRFIDITSANKRALSPRPPNNQHRNTKKKEKDK